MNGTFTTFVNDCHPGNRNQGWNFKLNNATGNSVVWAGGQLVLLRGYVANRDAQIANLQAVQTQMAAEIAALKSQLLVTRNERDAAREAQNETKAECDALQTQFDDLASAFDDLHLSISTAVATADNRRKSEQFIPPAHHDDRNESVDGGVPLKKI